MCDPELKAELQGLGRTVASLSGNVSQLSHTVQELSWEVRSLSGKIDTTEATLSEEQIARRDTDLELFKGLQKTVPAQTPAPEKPDSDPPIRVEISLKKKALVAALVAALLAVLTSLVGLQ